MFDASNHLHAGPAAAGFPPRVAHALPAPGPDDSQRGTHTLERALSVLKAFGGHDGPLSHAELVRRTGFSKASVSRITATLVALGYVERASDGVRFRIGMRGSLLGHTYRANSPLGALAQPVMQAFADKHDMAVALGIANGCDVLYIEYCKSARIATLRMAVGGRIPMEVTAIGRTYLWAQAPHERARLMAKIARKERPGAAQALARTRLAFEQLDQDGFCVAHGEFQRDSYGISVPVSLGQPEIPLALSCCGILPAPRETYIRDVLAVELKATAQRLREALSDIDSTLF